MRRGLPHPWLPTPSGLCGLRSWVPHTSGHALWGGVVRPTEPEHHSSLEYRALNWVAGLFVFSGEASPLAGWWLDRLERVGLPCQGALPRDTLKTLLAFLCSSVAFLVTPRGHVLSAGHSTTGCDGKLTRSLTQFLFLS